jgi:hypothetical protein
MLNETLDQERRRQAAWERIRSLVEQPRAVIGGELPLRSELHER